MTPPRPHRPTIMDVARTAGVSSATVSRVMNGASTVDKELSRRVPAAVRSTGYVPNAMGRSLRRGGTAQIAVVAPDADNLYFMQIVSEMERTARGWNHAGTVAHTGADLELVRAAVRTTGYVPNAMRRCLRRGGRAQIAVVAADAGNPYFRQIISEMERIARGENHSVPVAHREDGREVGRASMTQLVSRHVSG